TGTGTGTGTGRGINKDRPSVKVNSFRVVACKENDGKNYLLWFSSSHDGLAVISLFATGMQRAVDLHIANVSAVSFSGNFEIEKGNVLLNVSKGERACIKLRILESYIGPIEVVQPEIERSN
ncbi:TPA: hypothetical protein ACKP2J_004927, partial [Serratia marcescens]